MMPANGNGRGHLNLATSIPVTPVCGADSASGKLAARMSVPRTYVSKIENEKATPTLSSLERLARALEVTVPDFAFRAANATARKKSVELMKRSVYRGTDALRVATKRDAVVECTGAGP